MNAQSTGRVALIGHIWQPGVGICAQRVEISSYDFENIEQPITRESVLNWLYLHTGDFQDIEDFSAYVAGVEIPWSDEENEFAFIDCMYPSEDDD